MKRQSSISSWVNASKKAREDSDKDHDLASSGTADVADSSKALRSPSLSDSVTTSDKDTSAESAGPHDSEVEESRRSWCEFFRKREGKVSRRYVRCKICASSVSLCCGLACPSTAYPSNCHYWWNTVQRRGYNRS